jgi:hypothetical protein
MMTRILEQAKEYDQKIKDKEDKFESLIGFVLPYDFDDPAPTRFKDVRDLALTVGPRRWWTRYVPGLHWIRIAVAPWPATKEWKSYVAKTIEHLKRLESEELRMLHYKIFVQQRGIHIFLPYDQEKIKPLIDW